MFKNLNSSSIGISGHQSEIIELTLTYGFAGLDVNIVEFAAAAHAKGMSYAKRYLASSKLEIGSFVLPITWDAEDGVFQQELKKLPEFTQCAAELGCTRATSILSPAGDTRPYHENFELHRRRIGEVCAVLNESGIRLAVGFRAAERYRRDRAFQFIHDLDALVMLLGMAAASNLGLLLDTWEVVAAGGSAESLRKLASDQIVAVQVAEMPSDVATADLDDKFRLLPGVENGRVDVAAFVSLLKEVGYQGPVTVKASRDAFANHNRESVVKQTAEALGKVW